MNWTQLIKDMQAQGLTLEQIGDAAGMSKGHVHDLKTGRNKAVLWETGEKLICHHKRVMRRKKKGTK